MSTSTQHASPHDSRRTTIFVGVAVACLAITAIVEWANRPQEIEEFGKVGQEFYPEFTDPTVATSLSVKVIDADELKPLEFSVKQASNGRWVIPSHHDYPADAADQLAQTASSVIGIEREAMVTRWPSDHPRYGVVDPETDSVTVDEIEGIGKRLTFRGPDDEVLASYVIGKKVEGEENRYYVRHPAEDETYIAELDIELSTKFSDWVKTDLLDINNTDIKRLVLHDYSFEERGRSLAVTNTIETKLSRESSSDDWNMDGLDEATKQINAEALDQTVNTLANLAIAGVRPKQPGLTGDLDFDRSVVGTQRDVDRIQADLLSRGFLLQPDPSNPDKLRLIAREGEMSVGTADGLVYQLHFGRAFTGSDEELEIGFSSSDDSTDDQGDNEENEEKVGEENGDEPGAEEAEEAADSSNGKPGRYVFVRVTVDPNLLGEKPNPVEPEKPAELIEAEKKAAEATEESEGAQTEATEDSEAAEDSADETEDSADETEDSADETEDSADDTEDGADDTAETDAEQESEGEESQGDQEEGDPEQDGAVDAETKLQELRDAFSAAQAKYETDKQALADFEKQIQAADEKAEELNRRFALWYYVIPGAEYDNLSLKQEDLVEGKENEDGTPVGEPRPNLQFNLPTADNPGLPIESPRSETETQGQDEAERQDEAEGNPETESAADADADADAPAPEEVEVEVEVETSEEEPATEQDSAKADSAP